MSKTNALYLSARYVCVTAGMAVVVWHLVVSQDYYELLAVVVGIWFGTWLQDLVNDLRRT